MDEGTKALTFWDHLDVLRSSLIRMAVAVMVLGVVAFCLKDALFSRRSPGLASPLRRNGADGGCLPSRPINTICLRLRGQLRNGNWPVPSGGGSSGGGAGRILPPLPEAGGAGRELAEQRGRRFPQDNAL